MVKSQCSKCDKPIDYDEIRICERCFDNSQSVLINQLQEQVQEQSEELAGLEFEDERLERLENQIAQNNKIMQEILNQLQGGENGYKNTQGKL